LVRLLSSPTRADANELEAREDLARTDSAVAERLRVAKRYASAVIGLERAFSHLKRASGATREGVGRAGLEAMIRFASATRHELRARRPALSKQEVIATVKSVADEAVGERGAIYARILVPASELGARFVKERDEIQAHARVIATQLLTVTDLKQIASGLILDVDEFLASREQRRQEIATTDKDLDGLLIAAGFREETSPARAEKTEVSQALAARKPEQPYPAYLVYRYLRTAGWEALLAARKEAETTRESIRERKVAELADELAADLLKWLESHKEELSAVEVRQVIRGYKSGR
jgi:hypothetical protein